jgi:hypothetical protein
MLWFNFSLFACDFSKDTINHYANNLGTPVDSLWAWCGESKDHLQELTDLSSDLENDKIGSAITWMSLVGLGLALPIMLVDETLGAIILGVSSVGFLSPNKGRQKKLEHLSYFQNRFYLLDRFRLTINEKQVLADVTKYPFEKIQEKQFRDVNALMDLRYHLKKRESVQNRKWFAIPIAILGYSLAYFIDVPVGTGSMGAGYANVFAYVLKYGGLITGVAATIYFPLSFSSGPERNIQKSFHRGYKRSSQDL